MMSKKKINHTLRNRKETERDRKKKDKLNYFENIKIENNLKKKILIT